MKKAKKRRKGFGDPPKAVHVDTSLRLELVFRVARKANFGVHRDVVNIGPGFDEGEVETITIEGCHHGRLDVADVFKPLADESLLRK